MNATDLIQLGVAVLTSVTLVVLVWQTIIQNRLAKAQILVFFNERYLKLSEPGGISFALDQIKIYPEQYFDKEIYKKQYAKRPKAVKKYLYFAHVYEYFNFAFMLDVGKVVPIDKSIKAWMIDVSSEKEFLDVHNYYKQFYPAFAAYLTEIIDQRK